MLPHPHPSRDNYFSILVYFCSLNGPSIFFVNTIHQVIWASPGTLGRCLAAIIHVPLEVKKYFTSRSVQIFKILFCSGDLILQNLILRTRSCGSDLITQSIRVFLFKPTWSGWNVLFHSCTSTEVASRGGQSLQKIYTWLGAGRVHLCLRDFQNTYWLSGCSLKSFLHTFQTISDESIKATSIQDCNLPRPYSPIWEKWNGSFGQTPCPTCPTKIWRNPTPCPTCPTKIWKPPSPCPTCPTYSNLSQLVPFDCTTCPFPTLFSELFFWVSHWHSIFRKTLLNEKFVLTWTAMANIVASPTIAHISVLCSNQTYKLLYRSQKIWTSKGICNKKKSLEMFIRVVCYAFTGKMYLWKKSRKTWKIQFLEIPLSVVQSAW